VRPHRRRGAAGTADSATGTAAFGSPYQLSNTATLNGPAGVTELDPADKAATDLTLVDGIFADGFESGTTGGWSAATP
jgi:hypothetical protein